MKVEIIKSMVDNLKHQMSGHNYQVTFGVDIFDNCITTDDFKRKLKQTYPNSRPESIDLIQFDKTDFWEEIDYGMTYCGDNTAGLKLSSKKEEQLLTEQSNFKVFIDRFISNKTEIYSYPDEEGIPGYAVYWEFAFIVINMDRPSLFIYGSASD